MDKQTYKEESETTCFDCENHFMDYVKNLVALAMRGSRVIATLNATSIIE